MPKLTKPDVQFSRVSRLLKGYGVTARSLSETLGCSWRTAQKKMLTPEALTLGDLARISRSAGIPMDEIRANVVN